MARCPFYGCRWPERSPHLEKSERNECGLDIERHGGCKMETEGRNADYFSCSVALEMERLLNSSENVVTIPGQSGPVTLRDWKERNGR